MIVVRVLIAALLVHTWSVASAADAWIMPRTSEGVPNLQGIWTNSTITTLERPDDVDSLVLTPEQAAELEQKNADFYEAYDQPTPTDDEALPEGGDPGGYNTFWMDPGTHLAVVNGEIRSSLIVDPADGEIPYRLKARWNMFWRFIDFIGHDDPEQRPLGERCMVGFGSTGGPPMLPVLYNNNYQIVQTADTVMILVEMNQDARIIRIDSEHAPPDIRPWLGDSIGRWDGDTLVVETTNFHPGQGLRVATQHALFSSLNLKVTERFAMIGPGEILYTFEMDDPDVYSSVWRAEIPMRRAPGPIYEYACHEGNYALPNILAGARAEDRARAENPWWKRWF